jgi:hypothetical protein
MLKAQLWEATAVPELRQHACALATQVAQVFTAPMESNLIELFSLGIQQSCQYPDRTGWIKYGWGEFRDFSKSGSSVGGGIDVARPLAIQKTFDQVCVLLVGYIPHPLVGAHF